MHLILLHITLYKAGFLKLKPQSLVRPKKLNALVFRHKVKCYCIDFFFIFFTLMKREKTQSSKFKIHENSVTVLANYAIKAKI